MNSFTDLMTEDDFHGGDKQVVLGPHRQPASIVPLFYTNGRSRKRREEKPRRDKSYQLFF